ncbi:terminase small subunit [Lysinibacillus sp. Bpr_S20]|uniref:terminase small subunit n=1 Tax=Lysinibacillus sp. Bpr_S20 TaxID=2933964 RepID=UPI002011D94A|nr:terminase small subunit [Lysinibacillus sp. Bpr_S20]MCL1701612.1 terminase small subunit [Lysinibacillus sp. Bpr_S20]
MARARDPKRNEAYELYKVANGNIKLKDIAEQLGVAEGTVRGWKNKDRWDDRLEEESNGTFRKKEANNTERSAKKKTKRSKVQPGAETKATVQFEIVPSDGLNSQQLLFCIYYTKYWNATKAYQKVYGCDYASAMSNGSRLLRNDKVRVEIDRLKAELANGIMLDARTVLQKYIDIAFADITDFVEFGTSIREERDENNKIILDTEGNPVTYPFPFVNFKSSDEIDGTIITEVKRGKDGVSIKLADKMAALAMLVKYTDVLDEKIRKQLQNEQAKLNIDKTKVEIENIDGGNKNQASEDWVTALGKVAERRKVKAHE